MSGDSTMPKWLNWFSPSNLAKPESSSVDVTSSASPLPRLISKPLDIKACSLKDRIGSCFRLHSSVAVKTFLPLQRLDSTGNQDTDFQPRFSYPPYRTVEPKISSQIFEQSDLAVKRSDTAQSWWQHNCEGIHFRTFLSTMSGPVSKAAQKFTSLPTNLDKTEEVVDNMSNQYKKPVPHQSLIPQVSTAAFGNVSDGHLHQHRFGTTDTMIVNDMFNLCIDGPSTIKCKVPEIQIMSTECFNEVQSREASNSKKTPQPIPQGNVTEEEYTVCQNLEDKLSMAAADYTESVSDDESWYDTASDTDDSSDSELEDCVQASSRSLPTSDTDSEDLCPWDKLTSGRRSWTCNKAKKPEMVVQEVAFADAELKDSNIEVCKEQGNVMPQEDFASDSGFAEADADCDLPLEITVKRPVCSNSHISFILGCSAEDSDSEDDSDDEEGHCSSRTSSFSDDWNASDKQGKENPCKIWEYFERLQEPFTKLMCGYEPVKNVCQPEEGAQVMPKEETRQTALPPKQPTKVRFSDKVVIHPMVTWSFAYKQARKGKWECYARDRDRFQARALAVEEQIAWCLLPGHRQHVFHLRFGQQR